MVSWIQHILGAAFVFLILFGPVVLLLYMDAIRFRFAGRSTFRVPFLPVYRQYEFTFAGRRFKLGASDLAAYEYVRHLAASRAEARANGDALRSLIAAREDFRRILNAHTTAGLVKCAAAGTEEEPRIALWLLGRAHDRSAVPAINAFAASRSVTLRREATRTLRRLGAWTEMRAIAENDPDERIRKLAQPAPPREFSKRLNDFAGDHDRPPVFPPAREFCLFTTLNSTSDGRPKSRELIARLLRHIRQLLRGHA